MRHVLGFFCPILLRVTLAVHQAHPHLDDELFLFQTAAVVHKKFSQNNTVDHFKPIRQQGIRPLSNESKPSDRVPHELASPAFWNARYQHDLAQPEEWFLSWNDIKDDVTSFAQPSGNQRVLMIGCGNSRMSEQMYDTGFTSITNVDISDIVIDQMQQRYSNSDKRMEWRQGDARALSDAPGSYDLVVDKGTLDAMISNGSAELQFALVREMNRVLALDGYYVVVSLSSERAPIFVDAMQGSEFQFDLVLSRKIEVLSDNLAFFKILDNKLAGTSLLAKEDKEKILAQTVHEMLSRRSGDDQQSVDAKSEIHDRNNHTDRMIFVYLYVLRKASSDVRTLSNHEQSTLQSAPRYEKQEKFLRDELHRSGTPATVCLEKCKIYDASSDSLKCALLPKAADNSSKSSLLQISNEAVAAAVEASITTDFNEVCVKVCGVYDTRCEDLRCPSKLKCSLQPRFWHQSLVQYPNGSTIEGKFRWFGASEDEIPTVIPALQFLVHKSRLALVLAGDVSRRILPPTYFVANGTILPVGLNRRIPQDFVDEMNKEGRLWFLKNSANDSALDLHVFQSPSDALFHSKKGHNVETSYVLQPQWPPTHFLIDGHVCHVRTYLVVVTRSNLGSADQPPLEIFSLNDGLVQLAPEPVTGKYEKDQLITNAHYQKNLADKQKKLRLLSEVSDLHHIDIQRNINNILTDIFSVLVDRGLFCSSPHPQDGRKCQSHRAHMLLGADWLFDETGRPWLLEVNAEPGMNVSSSCWENLFQAMPEQLQQLASLPLKHFTPTPPHLYRSQGDPNITWGDWVKIEIGKKIDQDVSVLRRYSDMFRQKWPEPDRTEIAAIPSEVLLPAPFAPMVTAISASTRKALQQSRQEPLRHDLQRLNVSLLADLFDEVRLHFHPQRTRWKAQSCYMERKRESAPMGNLSRGADLFATLGSVFDECDRLFVNWYNKLHPTVGERSVSHLQSFVTRYRAGEGAHSPRHIDGVHVDGSLVLGLPTYESFASSGGLTVWDGDEVFHYPLAAGDVILLDNSVWHQSEPVTQGERWVLVIFYRVHAEPHAPNAFLPPRSSRPSARDEK